MSGGGGLSPNPEEPVVKPGKAAGKTFYEPNSYWGQTTINQLNSHDPEERSLGLQMAIPDELNSKNIEGFERLLMHFFEDSSSDIRSQVVRILMLVKEEKNPYGLSLFNAEKTILERGSTDSSEAVRTEIANYFQMFTPSDELQAAGLDLAQDQSTQVQNALKTALKYQYELGETSRGQEIYKRVKNHL